MKAAVQTGYGSPDVLHLANVDQPVPQEDELLIRIRATSVTRADGMMRTGTPFYGRLFLGLTKPKHPIPGTGFAGIIEAVGSDVNSFEVGDRVFGETYDIIFDTVGKSSFSRARHSLTDNGVYLSPVLGVPLLFRMLWTSVAGRKKAKFSATGMLPESDLRRMLEELKMLIEAGKLRMVIDRQYPLELIVEAHRYVDAGHKRGNVVVTLNHNSG